MSSAQIERIQDDELRLLMEQANQHLNAGETLECVEVCADAYLKLLEKHPEVLAALEKVLAVETVKKAMEVGSLRFAPLMWPRLAAKLHLIEGKKPEIIFDRQYLGFSEAIQYYEFTLNLGLDAEKGTLNTTVRPVGT